jgi:phage-related protein
MANINDYRILVSNVPYYETGIAVNTFDIVYYTGVPFATSGLTGPFSTGYYYAHSPLGASSHSQNMRPDGSSGPNFWTQDFFFKPSYGSSIEFNSSLFNVEYNDGYYSIIGRSENTVRANLSLTFKGATDKEAKAIAHYYQRIYIEQSKGNGQGMQTVAIGAFTPHSKKRDYYIQDVSHNMVYPDINDVEVKFTINSISNLNWKEKLIPFDPLKNYWNTQNENYEKYDYAVLVTEDVPYNRKGFHYYSGDVAGVSNPATSSNWTQKFFFEPDEVQDLNFKAKAYDNTLGDFTVKQLEGLNPNAFDFQLKFKNVTNKKAKAILHFLESKNGNSLFQMDMFAPYTGTRNFFCPQWSHTYNFKDNNEINARLVESKLQVIPKGKIEMTASPITGPTGPTLAPVAFVGWSIPRTITVVNVAEGPGAAATAIEEPKIPTDPNSIIKIPVKPAIITTPDPIIPGPTSDGGGYPNEEFGTDGNGTKGYGANSN